MGGNRVRMTRFPPKKGETMASPIRFYPEPLPHKEPYPLFGFPIFSPKDIQALLHGFVSFCLGITGLYLCASGQVGWILAPKFFPWLAWGCAALIVLSVYAMACSFRHLLSAIKTRGKFADSCCTRHPDAVKDCKLVLYAPVRFALLSFPLGLVLFGMPSQGLASATALGLHLFQTRSIETRGSAKVPSFQALLHASQSPEGRAHYEGTEVWLIGRILGIQSDRFTLIRYRMTCCAADASVMKAGVCVEGAMPGTLLTKEWEGKHVKIRGHLQFHQDKDQTWLPILVIPPITPENPLSDWIQESSSGPGDLYEIP